MIYCSNCVVPARSAVAVTFDENGVCSACRVAAQKHKIDWSRRYAMLQELVDEYRRAIESRRGIALRGGRGR